MATPRPFFAVSLSAYDGYTVSQALESLARIGVRHVECDLGGGADMAAAVVPSPKQLRHLQLGLRAAGMVSSSVRCALDLTGPDALAQLHQAIETAATLGAQRLVLPAVAARYRQRACRHLAAVSSHMQAASLGVALMPRVEDGEQALPDAADLVADVNLPWLGLAFDTAQAAQAQAGVPVRDQLEAVRPLCRHLNLCDVRQHEGWFPVPMGDGAVRAGRMLRGLSRSAWSMTLALPLRWHRDRAGLWRRAPYRVPMPDIEAALRRSLDVLVAHRFLM